MADLRAQVEISARDRFSGPADAAGRSASRLADRVREGERALGRMGREREALTSLDQLGRATSRTASRMAIAARRTADLRARIKATEEPTKKLRREFAAAQRQSTGLYREHRRQVSELRRMRTELLGAAAGSRDLARAQREVEERIDGARRAMGRMADAAKRGEAARSARDRSLERAAQVGLAAESAGRLAERVLGVAGRAVERSRAIARTEGDLRSVGLSREDARVVSRRGRDVQRTLPYVTADEFTGAAYSIQSGIEGLDGAGVADLTEAAATLARATRSSVEEMTSLTTTGWAIFRRAGEAPAEFGGRLAAQISRAVEGFSTTGPDMQQAIESAGAKPALLGISLSEQIAALGLLQSTMSGSEAGTTVRALAAALPQAQEYFDEHRPGAVRLIGDDDRARPLVDLLAELRSLYGAELGASESAELAKALGREEAVRFFDQFWKRSGDLQDAIAAQQEAGGQGLAYASAIQRRRDDNADARLQIVQQRWDAVMIQLGESALPAIESLAGFSEAAAGALESLAEKAPGLTTFIVGGTVALTALAFWASRAAIALASISVLRQQGRAWQAGRAERRTSRDLPGSGPRAGGRLGRAGGRLADARQAARRRAPSVLRRIPRGGPAAIAIGTAAGLAPSLLGSGRDEPEDPEAGRYWKGSLAGGLAGAAAGFAFGSVVPGPGNVLGALAGAALGAFGADVGEEIERRLSGGPQDAPEAPPEPAVPAIPTAVQAVRETRETAPERPPAAGEVHHHHGDISIRVEPLAGEDPDSMARRIWDLARDEEAAALDGALVDGVY